MVVEGKIEINPLDVIQKLIEEKMSLNQWLIDEGNSYYISQSTIGSFEERKIITKEEYDYIKALILIRSKLFNKK